MYNTKGKAVQGPRLQAKRDSLPEEIGFKEILLEMQKIALRQDTQFQALHEEIQSFKQELKEEMKTLKEDLEKVKRDNQNMIKSQSKLEYKVEKLENLNQKSQLQAEMMENRELEYQLRIRHLEETAKEDLKKIIIELLAELMNTSANEIDQDLDRVYRITTGYSKRNKTTRDAIITFTRKRIRDEILKENAKRSIFYKDKRVIIMKEVSQQSLARCRKYAFLTEELSKRRIKFRWEKTEGITVTFNDIRYWLNTEEKARAFYETHMKEKAQLYTPKDYNIQEKGKQRDKQGRKPDERETDEDGPDDERNDERERELKKLRQFSPENSQLLTSQEVLQWET
nr:PREDICTED: polyamine-modulated factor 1-binding protein 1-like [Anolis carolinensis]|eukprot:XP_016850382.1 PREDICTED: polyamine-modulated factor 1-binding protein 1-like [Anolis carolinensis]